MKRVIVAISVSACLLVGIVIARQNVRAENRAPAAVTSLDVPQTPAPQELQSCGSNSDCKYGICSGGKCGACSGSSDCNGWGTCSQGQCGSCGSNSDCTTFGDCNSGKCSKSPY